VTATPSATTRIDVAFDVRDDTPRGKDPDAHSPTLRKYHRWLWNKPLPSGVLFELGVNTPRVYLHHKSRLGEFFLSSDSVIPSFTKQRALSRVLEQIPLGDRDRFSRLTYTIGGMIVFPANQVAGKMTINGQRGCHPRIKDRFDLTVECIRRHYCALQSPLTPTLDRYADFFGLFESFEGYVDFFLLQDLVTRDYSAVRFFAPFTDFEASPLPATLEAYLEYCDRASEFIQARNARILGYDASRANIDASY
jgi:hypothetical protein